MSFRCLRVAVLLFAVACAPPPLTADEFRRQISGSSRLGGARDWDLALPMESAFRRISEPALRCYNAEYLRPGNAFANDSGGHTVVRARVEDPASGRASIIVQVEELPHPRGPGRHMPQGGFYQFVVDLESVGSARTKLTVYGPTAFGYQGVFDSFEAWTRDPRAPCPRWPGW